MAKAKREPTRYPGIYKVGNRYEWVSRRAGRSGTCATLAEARGAKATADGAQPVAPEARGPFGAWARDWVASYQGRTKRGFSEATRMDYRISLESHAIPFFDDERRRKWADIGRPDVKAYAAWLSTREHKGRRLSPKTIDGHLAVLRILFNDAIDDGIYHGQNPVKGVRANARNQMIDMDADDNDRRAFTIDELDRVLRSAGEGDHRLMLTCLSDTGVRWGEFCELRGRDLKTTPNGPVLCVRRAYSDKTKTIGRPKSGKIRDIPISPDLARSLWRLQRDPSELLFQSPFGQRLSYPNTLRRVLAPILADASKGEGDLTWAAFHTFRHTFASLLVAQGANIKRVSKMLGHHSASYTLDVYTHLFPDDLGPTVSVADLVAGGNTGATFTSPTSQDEPKPAPAKSAVFRG